MKILQVILPVYWQTVSVTVTVSVTGRSRGGLNLEKFYKFFPTIFYCWTANNFLLLDVYAFSWGVRAALTVFNRTIGTARGPQQ